MAFSVPKTGHVWEIRPKTYTPVRFDRDVQKFVERKLATHIVTCTRCGFERECNYIPPDDWASIGVIPASCDVWIVHRLMNSLSVLFRMDALIFRGKNWKLASPKKWTEGEVDVLIKEVGMLEKDGTQYVVHETADGFAAVERADTPATDESATETAPDAAVKTAKSVYVVAVSNSVLRISVSSEGEARNRAEALAKDRKTVCSLHRLDDGKYTTIGVWDGRKK